MKYYEICNYNILKLRIEKAKKKTVLLFGIKTYISIFAVRSSDINMINIKKTK